IQCGGMAAVTITFARYFLELTGWRISESVVAALTLLLLTVINCAGVKLGSRVQSGLMVLRILAIALLIGAGLWRVRAPHSLGSPILEQSASPDLLMAFAAALIPVLFAYGGWQTANFIAGEIKEPRRNLTRALIIGVAAVALLYVTVNFVCLRALGPAELANSRAPATAVMRLTLGQTGATWIAVGIAISTLGFLSQAILTAPRVYFAMAD